MMATLDGRVALVTGAGRGVGRGIARRLAREGAVVAVNYRRDEESARATVEEIRSAGGTAAAYLGSVDRWEDCERMTRQVLDEHGKVDILVNNGGIASRGSGVVDTEPDEVQRLFATHALGPFMLSKLLVPQMRGLERSDIVMISSVTVATAPPGSAPYTMAKSAMETLARTLAVEERDHGVRVNVVAPGLVATDMGDRLAKAVTHGEATSADDLGAGAPFGRVCQPDDVAGVVAFLVSSDGSYVTGARVVVDGGSDLVLTR
jgi:NAD(P)-dependent dehydrogenase (short-subunit alcohol dehydrogenase family)